MKRIILILRLYAGDSLDSYTDAFLAHRAIVRKEQTMSHKKSVRRIMVGKKKLKLN